jgi:hypothetical protein
MKEALLSKCAELPSEMVNVLLSKFSINGAHPVTLDDLKAVLNSAVDQMRAELRDALPASRPPAAQAPLIDPNLDPRFHLWSWGGRMHMVPQDWVFPSMDAKATWNLWHFGHVGDHIRPLRYLKKCDLKDAAQVTLWSKAGQVMKLIAHVMVEMKLVQSIEEVEKLSATVSAEAFDKAIVQLMEQVKEGTTRGKRRWMEMVVPTMYAVVGSVRKRRQLEAQVQREQVMAEAAGR